MLLEFARSSQSRGRQCLELSAFAPIVPVEGGAIQRVVTGSSLIFHSTRMDGSPLGMQKHPCFVADAGTAREQRLDDNHTWPARNVESSTAVDIPSLGRTIRTSLSTTMVTMKLPSRCHRG
jgi:hypothetical protein